MLQVGITNMQKKEKGSIFIFFFPSKPGDAS